MLHARQQRGVTQLLYAAGVGFLLFFLVISHTFISLSSVEAAKIEFNLAVARWVSGKKRQRMKRLGTLLQLFFSHKKVGLGLKGSHRDEILFLGNQKGTIGENWLSDFRIPSC